MTSPVQILVGDCLETLRTLPDSSVRCCVTSPPYWALRDYGVAGQIGLEATLWDYLEKMVAVFREVRRVLTDDGTAWVNLGDCYIGGGGGGAPSKSSTLRGNGHVGGGPKLQTLKPSFRRDRAAVGGVSHKSAEGLKEKDLAGVPWRVAFALQEDGWFLRQNVIWAKPNPMPESVRDRPTTAHEFVFLLSKAPDYFYNAAEAREPVTGGANARLSKAAMREVSERRAQGAGATDSNEAGHGVTGKCAVPQFQVRHTSSLAAAACLPVEDRNFRSVWSIPTDPFKGAHFAAFPRALAARCIIAGTEPGDTVLDPFAGSGTTGAAALELGRRAVLCELNPDYAEMIRDRVKVTPGLPLQFNS